MHRLLLPPVLAAALALTACSSPTPAATHKPSPTALAPITGKALERIVAEDECRTLVRHRLKFDDTVTPVTDDTVKPSGGSWVAAGKLSHGSAAWTYQCTIGVDGKGNVTAEAVDWIYPA